MHMINWTMMAEKKPDIGQLCVIKFSAKTANLRLVVYDNKESWEKRTLKDINDEELHDAFKDAWFTEADDDEDWWEPQYVEQWMAVPPSRSST